MAVPLAAPCDVPSAEKTRSYFETQIWLFGWFAAGFCRSARGSAKAGVFNAIHLDDAAEGHQFASFEIQVLLTGSLQESSQLKV